MVEKIKEVIRELPNHKYSIRDAGLKVGYSPSYAKGLLYRTIRDYKLRTEEDVRLVFLEQLDKDIKRFKTSDKDNPCYCRLLELKSKILALQKDISETTTRDLTEEAKNNITSLLDKRYSEPSS